MTTLNIGDRVKVNDPSLFGSTVGKVLAVLDSNKVRVLFEVYHPSLTVANNKYGVVYPIDKVKPFEGKKKGNNSKFWMVVGDGPTSLNRTSKEFAEIEAERLAKDNPGNEYFVLEAVSCVKYARVVKRTL